MSVWDILCSSILSQKFLSHSIKRSIITYKVTKSDEDHNMIPLITGHHKQIKSTIRQQTYCTHSCILWTWRARRFIRLPDTITWDIPHPPIFRRSPKSETTTRHRNTTTERKETKTYNWSNIKVYSILFSNCTLYITKSILLRSVYSGEFGLNNFEVAHVTSSLLALAVSFFTPSEVSHRSFWISALCASLLLDVIASVTATATNSMRLVMPWTIRRCTRTVTVSHSCFRKGQPNRL